ncbi:TMEM175 family protein [Sphingomonas mesophila]|uniref:TMEM175 family protein n=1 Tax=Sphingomonas mesophila TaxID=2303576 RepID=UPI0013C2C92F|nr:TMEM175 family protein [Sphingomonas mesophila]
MSSSSARLDNFTDAAFAFAVSLLIIGGGGTPDSTQSLFLALGDLPAFAFGFAILVMFWISHVRWRAIRGDGDTLSVGLTLLLVFLILVYVQPLRSMAAATSHWFTGQGGGFSGEVAPLFTIYGLGFTAMSLVTAALFADALRNRALSEQQRMAVRGDRNIWLIHTVTGLVSVLVSLSRFGELAAVVYASLPVTIGLYSWRYDWSGERRG